MTTVNTQWAYEDPTLNLATEEGRDTVSLAYLAWIRENVSGGSVKWCGVPTYKLPSDMWLYQDIIHKIKPGLILEFGTHNGGAALFFSNVLKRLGNNGHILTMDNISRKIDDRVLGSPNIETMHTWYTAKYIRHIVTNRRQEFKGPMFVLFDRSIRASSVVLALENIRNVVLPGDYVVVEKNEKMNAVAKYMQKYPQDYSIDTQTEHRFGLTFAPGGFLVRKNNE